MILQKIYCEVFLSYQLFVILNIEHTRSNPSFNQIKLRNVKIGPLGDLRLIGFSLFFHKSLYFNGCFQDEKIRKYKVKRTMNSLYWHLTVIHVNLKHDQSQQADCGVKNIRESVCAQYLKLQEGNNSNVFHREFSTISKFYRSSV